MTRLPRLLFRLACLTSGLLVLAVLAAPWLDGRGNLPRVVSLFAHDAALRRCTLATALGLLVTACVFFQPPTDAPGP
jgi:hypothetical protein